MSKLKNVVVVAYGRSAVGRAGKKGVFRETHPLDLGAGVLKGVLETKLPQLDPALIDDVIMGCANQDMKQSYNPARMVTNAAGIPYSVPAMSINRFCSSGLQAIAIGAAEIESGLANIVVAGGCESMTAVPMTLDRTPYYAQSIVENDPNQYISMGMTAENVAERYHITRVEMEEMAVRSHAKAAAAQEAGKFDNEIIPLPGVDENGNAIVVDKDQGIRKGTSMESLANLMPCFKEDGVVTAATSSQTSDGAAFVVLMSTSKAEELGIKPIAKFIGFAVAGCDPAYMGTGPMYAVPKVMELTGLTADDMDVIEINEAFAAQAIPCIRELKLNMDKVNPNGGAMALAAGVYPSACAKRCKYKFD